MSVPASRSPDFPPHDAYRGKTYFDTLDGLRFLCIAAVLWHHAPIWKEIESVPRILTRGFVGVDFFFVLSGFLISALLLREEEETGRISLSHFYWRRVLRIAPPFLLLVGFVALYWIVVKGRWDYLQVIPYYIFFLSNFLTDDIPMLTVTWSLAVEEQFYLIWPAIMLLTLAAARRRAVLLIGAIVLNVVAITHLAASPDAAPEFGPLTLKLPAATYAPLLIGALLALSLHHRRSFGILFPVLGRRLAAPVALLALLLALAWLPADLRGWPNLTMHLLMAALLGALVAGAETPLHRLLRRPALSRIGKVSYGIYLYHLVALHIVVTLTGAVGMRHPWLDLIGMALVSILLAELSYRTLEARFLRLRSTTPIWSRHRPVLPRRLTGLLRRDWG